MTIPRRQLDLIVEFLQRPDSYPDQPKVVEVKETHISYVFLTERFAYKMKKPTRFDFLDYSTLASRKKACDDELTLNRRLAPGVYLSVVPVCRNEQGTLSIGTDGNPVEWLVKMKRLDESKTLESSILNQELTARQVSDLAKVLASFYMGLAPQTIMSAEYRRSVTQHVRSNRADLLAVAAHHSDLINLTFAAQMRFLRLVPNLFDDRVCDGRIVDGHGDLRPEHVYLEPNPLIIDCIEFNAEFRRNDIADELGFLAMECDRLHSDSIGKQIIEAYCKASQDYPPVHLWSFYKCYRACVRAKVAALRAEQTSDIQQERHRKKVTSYLRLAQRYALDLGPRLMITMGGRIGSGKSTLASEIVEQLHATLIQTDAIRNELFETSNKRLAYEESKYSESNRDLVYERLFKQTPKLFEANPTVILDGTFSRASVRQRARETAEAVSANHIHIECECPREIALERIATRFAAGQTNSEARPEFYDRQAAEYEPPPTNNGLIVIDTTWPITKQIETVLNYVRVLIDERSTPSVALAH